VASPPIFIIGISQRCGTHYLYDLLVRHPDCRPALTQTSPWGSWEDHILHFSDELSRYADELVASNSLNDARTRELLMRSLGDGLLSFVDNLEPGASDARRPVSKSPLPENLDRFSELFPEAVAVLMVREPSAVVVSGMRTFGGSIDHWIRIWRDGARWITQFLQEHPSSAVLVRFEDLFEDPAGYLSALLPKLGLSSDRYDFSEARRLPVRGSSQLGGTPIGVQWLPVAPNETFNPLNRGKELSDVDRQRIRWRALPEMTTFGYAPDEFTGPGTFRAIYFQSQSTATRVIRGARLALRDLRDAQTRRLRRRRRRPRPLP